MKLKLKTLVIAISLTLPTSAFARPDIDDLTLEIRENVSHGSDDHMERIELPEYEKHGPGHDDRDRNDDKGGDKDDGKDDDKNDDKDDDKDDDKVDDKDDDREDDRDDRRDDDDKDDDRDNSGSGSGDD